MDEEKRFLTIPNILTILRIMVLPFVIYYITKDVYSYQKTIFILLGIQGLTDFLDGIIARKLKQISRLGKILDPLADKLTFDSIMIALLKYDFPLFIVILLLSRDIVIIFSGYSIFKKKKVIPVSNIWGKITTFSLVVYLISFIGGIEFLKSIFFYILLISITISGITYFIYFLKIYIRSNNE